MNKAELDTRVKKLVEEAPEVENIHFEMGSAAVVCIKDQSVLPAKDSVILAYSPQAIFDAIKMLKVRGAPAIGICAAFGIARAAVRVCGLEPYRSGEHAPQTQDVITYLDEVCAYLAASRPTAVNLFWAINRMRRVMYVAAGLPVPETDIVPDNAPNPEEPVYNPDGFEVLLAALYAPADEGSAADGAFEGGAADGNSDRAEGVPTNEVADGTFEGGAADGALKDTPDGAADGTSVKATVEASGAHSTDPETHAFDIACALVEEALRIQREDIEVCAAIAEEGLSLLKDGQTVITHCNAGPLATSKYGTALGPILLAKERGMNIKAFADETRPLLQGARLTTYELMEAGVDVTLICDNMSSYVMREGLIDAVMVGCDRVAANGDTANKIGTSMLALAAKHYGIPFYVMCPTSTIDLACESGDDITIELRDPTEISTKFYADPVTPAGVTCLNPAFDITEADLITAIVTERGCVYPPFTTGIRALFEK